MIKYLFNYFGATVISLCISLLFLQQIIPLEIIKKSTELVIITLLASYVLAIHHKIILDE